MNLTAPNFKLTRLFYFWLDIVLEIVVFMIFSIFDTNVFTKFSIDMQLFRMRITCYPDKSYPDTCIQTLVYRPLIPSIIVSLRLWTGKSQWHKFPKWLKTSVSRQLISRHLFPDTCFQEESRHLFPDTCFQQESRHLFPDTCFLESYPDTCFLTPVSNRNQDTCFPTPVS